MELTLRTTPLLADYDRLTRSVRMRLLDRYHAKHVWEMIAVARQELVKLIPEIPSIGKGNIWQVNLESSAMLLAVYRALKNIHYTLDESTQVIYDVSEVYLTRFSPLLLRFYRLYFFSQLNRDRLQHAAARSQSRLHSDDWVFTFLKGDGGSFDFGVDISECAILRFYRAQYAEELTPTVCHLDHATGKLLELGFSRQGTLSNRAAVCDCRWIFGAETQGWPPVSTRA